MLFIKLKGSYSLTNFVMNARLPIIFLLSFFLTLPGCVTIFSDFQSAETLGKGNIEVTPSASGVGLTNDGESERIQSNYGVQMGVGVADGLDARIRLELPTLIDEDLSSFGDFIVLAAGPKFRLNGDYIAAYLPLGFMMGEDVETSETWELQPTLLFSIPISDEIEFNPSTKFILPFNERDATYALNAGFAFWFDNIAIRPELGIMKSFEDPDGTFYHYGIGFTYKIIK